MPVAEFLELLEINLLGQVPQRLVGLLRVADATKGVNQPLPAVRHTHHRHDACLWLNAQKNEYDSAWTGRSGRLSFGGVRVRFGLPLGGSGLPGGDPGGEEQRDQGEEREGRERGTKPVQASLLVFIQDRLRDLLARACLGERLLGLDQELEEEQKGGMRPRRPRRRREPRRGDRYRRTSQRGDLVRDGQDSRHTMRVICLLRRMPLSSFAMAGA